MAKAGVPFLLCTCPLTIQNRIYRFKSAVIACEGTNRPVARFTSREGMLVEEAMTPAAKCRRMAAMLRVKADRECDPEARAEWQYVARGYLILSNQFERNGCKNISYASFQRIRDIDEEAP
jgi:hypothetical protein